MRSLVRIAIIVLLLVIVGGIAALAMLDIPAPTTHVEKVIPNDRFQH